MPDNLYQLFLKIDGRWRLIDNIYAPTHDEATRKAMASLKPDQFDKPMKLEYDEHAPTNRAKLAGEPPPKPFPLT
jgi:hypothetical protein